jgi:hypothetical protein
MSARPVLDARPRAPRLSTRVPRRLRRAATIAGALAIVLIAAWLVSVWQLPI